MTKVISMNKRLQLMAKDTTPFGLDTLHKKATFERLRDLGADWYDMLLPETHYLPRLIAHDEKIQGVVWGRYEQLGRYGQESSKLSSGRGLLVATDRRVLFIDKSRCFCAATKYLQKLLAALHLPKLLLPAQ